MRIGLLSTLANVADGRPRALVPLGGRPLIAWQMDLAKALGCDKLLCLAEGGDDTSTEVENQAELAGLPLEFLGGPRHLPSKITADQDLVVIADGLVMDPELAREHFLDRRGVAAVADYPGVEKGFERIDPELAWAGLLVARGSIGEQLSDMPADGDTVSLLLRMALQSGARVVRLDELHLSTGEILLARAPSDLADREKSLLDNSAAKVSWAGLCEKLASRFARALSPEYLPRGPELAIGLGALMLVAALVSSWCGMLALALAVLAIGGFGISVSQALRHLRTRLHGGLLNRKLSMSINALVDAAIIGTLAIAGFSQSWIDAVFEPILLVGLWRLAARLAPAPMRPFWRDRTSLAIILLMIASFGALPAALPFMILFLLFFALISEGYARLTQA